MTLYKHDGDNIDHLDYSVAVWSCLVLVTVIIKECSTVIMYLLNDYASAIYWSVLLCNCPVTPECVGVINMWYGIQQVSQMSFEYLNVSYVFCTYLLLILKIEGN